MENMAFFEELAIIQDEIINIMLLKENDYDSIQDLLTDTTYETIYRILEMLDGYGRKHIVYEITEKNGGYIFSRDMHDKCEEYLKSTDI